MPTIAMPTIDVYLGVRMSKGKKARSRLTWQELQDRHIDTKVLLRCLNVSF